MRCQWDVREVRAANGILLGLWLGAYLGFVLGLGSGGGLVVKLQEVTQDMNGLQFHRLHAIREFGSVIAAVVILGGRAHAGIHFLAESRLRSKDFKAAGDAYWNSFQHGGLNFTERFAAYAYAQSNDPASWAKGYAILKKLYDEKKATPGLIEFLKMLEQNLHLPATQRIPDAAPVRKTPDPQAGPLR